MKKTYVYSLITFLITLLYSQALFAQSQRLTREKFKDINKLSGVIPTKSSTKTVGSPYLNTKFVKGFILVNGSKTQTTYIRYNMAKNQVQFLRNKKILLANSSKISGFKLFGSDGNVTFNNGYHTTIKDINPATFLRSAYKGKTELVVLYKAHLMKNIATYETATHVNKYTYKHRYYVVTPEGKFYRFGGAESDLMKALPNHHGRMKQFLASHKLDLANENDVIKVLKYYDSLN